MKSILLIKQHPTIQLGHLYEHLFMRRVNEYFYENRLFKYLDYYAQGTTYEQGGIITVDCELYSKDAKELGHHIKDLRMNFDEDNRNISTALYQIAAEESERLYISSKKEVLAELKRLDSESWKNIDEFTLLDTRGFRRKNKPIYLTTQRRPKSSILRISLKLDKKFLVDNRMLSPLFMIIGRIILFTIGNRIAAEHGAYAGSEICVKENSSTMFYDLFITKEVSAMLSNEEIKSTSEKTVKYLLNKTTREHIVTQLASINYGKDPFVAPNVDRLFKESNLLIGSIGWREIATLKNVNDILNHILIEVKMGSQKCLWPIDEG